MLRRYKTKLTGPYSEREKTEIDHVTVLILSNSFALQPFKPISELERDYVRYIRTSLMRTCGLPFLTAGLSFMLVDKLPGLKRGPWPLRWTAKMSTFIGFYALGISDLKKDIYLFPLLDEVVAGGIVKFSKWLELPSDSHIDKVVIKD